MKVYDKLVRDKIPEIIRMDGKTPLCETLDDARYLVMLEKKLSEEVSEYLSEPCMDEMADLLEVIEAICHARGFDPDVLLAHKRDKAEKRGAFEKRILLHAVQDGSDKP